jgi:hypothetical protein
MNTSTLLKNMGTVEDYDDYVVLGSEKLKPLLQSKRSIRKIHT